MRVQLIPKRNDQGAVAVLVALAAVSLMLIAGFTLDFGWIYAQRQSLSSGADSASLAIVKQAKNEAVLAPNSTCASLLAADTAKAANNPTKSENIAVDQVNANWSFNGSIPASSITTTLDCVGTSAGTLRATVAITQDTSTFFGKLAGVSTVTITPTAAAALGAANDVRGYIPLAVCKSQADEIVANAAGGGPYRHELVLIEKVWGGGSSCGFNLSSGNGNWGWLFCGTNGVPGIANGISNGCPESLYLEGSPPHLFADGIAGNKGQPSSIQAAMATILNKPVTVPVYDSATGSGSNTAFNVVGFLSMKVCGYRDNNSTVSATPCYVTTDPVSGQNVTLVDNSLQVMYADYTPVGELNDNCAIGDTTCAFNTYVTKLIR